MAPLLHGGCSLISQFPGSRSLGLPAAFTQRKQFLLSARDIAHRHRQPLLMLLLHIAMELVRQIQIVSPKSDEEQVLPEPLHQNGAVAASLRLLTKTDAVGSFHAHNKCMQIGPAAASAFQQRLYII